MAFECVVVTPEQQMLTVSARQVILPAHDGMIGILTDRAPLLAKLGAGPLRVDKADGQSAFFFISGGVAQMKDNKLTILTEEAMAAEEVDFAAAQSAYTAALAIQPVDAASAAKRERELARARGMMATRR